MSNPGQDVSRLSKPKMRRSIRWALLRKEWQEQRWRFVLGTVVLSGMLAGLLRAQVVPHNEAALFIYLSDNRLVDFSAQHHFYDVHGRLIR